MSDTNEGCYRNDRPETHKIGNAYKVFFRSELACYYDALSSNGAITTPHFHAHISYSEVSLSLVNN